MFLRVILGVGCSLFPALSIAALETPSDEQIKKWLDPPQQVEINRVAPVTLVDGERAFLASVTFANRGRNFFAGALLVRPQLEAAKEVEEVGYEFEIHPEFNVEGPSVIETEIVFSGGGTWNGFKRLVVFDGFHPRVLHETTFEGNHGICGLSAPSTTIERQSKKVLWQFLDLDYDGHGGDLVETVVTSRGLDRYNLQWMASVNVFLYKDHVRGRKCNRALFGTAGRGRVRACP
jgi:hypothetical protein